MINRTAASESGQTESSGSGRRFDSRGKYWDACVCVCSEFFHVESDCRSAGWRRTRNSKRFVYECEQQKLLPNDFSRSNFSSPAFGRAARASATRRAHETAPFNSRQKWREATNAGQPSNIKQPSDADFLNARTHTQLNNFSMKYDKLIDYR